MFIAANILVSEDGRVQLCDFGVAGVLESKINKRTTILGTPHYMAPEMLDVIESNRIIHYGNEVSMTCLSVKVPQRDLFVCLRNKVVILLPHRQEYFQSVM